MQPKKNSKMTIIIVIVLLVLIGGGVYFYMSGTPTDTDPSLVITGASADGSIDSVGTRDLLLLNQIKNLKIDSSFFQSPAYSSLVDHTVPIYEQGVGKPNPFLNPHPNQTVTTH